ncbi:MAG: DUF2796 domain-containing protein [Pseudomonadota bacterium]
MHIKTSNTNRVLAAVLLCGVFFTPTWAQHVHGEIEIGVVVDGDAVAVSLRAPMSDVVGFEHAPQTEAQVASTSSVAALLHDADAMFGLSEDAGCSVAHVVIDAPTYVRPSAHEDSHDDDKHASHDHGHDDHDDHHASDDDHADQDHHDDNDYDDNHHEDNRHEDDHHGDEHASHDHGHDDHGDDHASDDHDDHDSHDHHDDHDHDEAEEHTEVNASYEWSCSDGDALNTLELRFIQGFASVENIEVQILTDSGARIVEAGADTTSISLSAP